MSTPTTVRRRRIAGERPRADQLSAGMETTPVDGRSTADAAPRPVKAAEPDADRLPDESEAHRTRSPRHERALFAASAILALVLVVAGLWLGLQTWSYADVRSQDRVEKAERTASATAERAATAILSFKHSSLDADLQASTRYMTPQFARTYTGTFDSLARPNAIRTRATVTAEVLATGVINASASRAEILVYVDQTTVSTANGGNPSVALNRASFDLVKVDGSWLVDDFHSY